MDQGTRAALADLRTLWAGRQVAPPKQFPWGKPQPRGGALEAWKPGAALAGQLRREVTLAGQRRREVTLAGQRRCEVTLAGQRTREVTLAGQRRREVTHGDYLGTDGASFPPPFCECLLVRPPSWLQTRCRVPPP